MFALEEEVEDEEETTRFSDEHSGMIDFDFDSDSDIVMCSKHFLKSNLLILSGPATLVANVIGLSLKVEHFEVTVKMFADEEVVDAIIFEASPFGGSV